MPSGNAYTDLSCAGHYYGVRQLAQCPSWEPVASVFMETPSFDSVYQEHFAFVWRSVKRLGVPPASIDDAAQDVFLVVHRRLSEFAGRSSVKTWLYGIVRRVVSDHRRRMKRKAPGESLPEHLADAGDNPQDVALKREAAALLYQVLDELDDDKREVFVLAELEQMPVPAIAEALGENVNTIYSRLRAARQRFEEAVSKRQEREPRAGLSGA